MGRIETEREKRVAQILATDTTREQLADALWCAEDCVRHLVERTSLLNDKISKLRTEFDKMDKWHSAELMAETDENRKLRELVRWMYDRMDESCAVQHPYAPAPISYDRLIQAAALAHELGVEVDG